MYRSLDRDRYQKKLTKCLEQANDEQLFEMIWSVNALQSGRKDSVHEDNFRYPAEALTSSFTSRFSIYPWKLETLLNESLRTRKIPTRRILDCKQFATAALLSNLVGKLENAFDGMKLLKGSALFEMGRIAQRQFEWQRGFLNIPNFYRSGFIYGGPVARQYFFTSYGIKMDDFGTICFGLRSLYQRYSHVGRGGGIPELSISEETLDTVWDMISLPYRDAIELARNLRKESEHISYRRSIFRLYPCVSFGSLFNKVYAPLPDLLTARSTSGLYYDIVADKESIREVGARFEQYSYELLDHFTLQCLVEREFSYQAKKGESYDSPDIIVSKGGDIEIIVECKATRMTYGAKFGESPLDEAAREYREIAKAVFQIWRFVSHIRKNICKGRNLSNNVRGLVLTLDTWLTMDTVIKPKIIDLVDDMIIRKSADIGSADRIPIVFCPMDDLEVTFRESNEESFLSTIRATTEERFQGWSLWSVHNTLEPDLHLDNEYPFAPRLGDVVGWAKYVNPEPGGMLGDRAIGPAA